MQGYIFFSERNKSGAWVVYGRLGIRQYYGYTKAEAEEKYKAECRQKIIDEVKK